MIEEASDGPAAEKPAKGKTVKKKPSRKKRAKAKNSTKRVRTNRVYPALSFEESLKVADAIHTHAAGERVSRLTLLKGMDLSPTSSATRILITSSGKYGITSGSYDSEYLALTEEGRKATDASKESRIKTQARFDLAIKGIRPFEVMYEKYKGKKLPSQDVLKDSLSEASLEVGDAAECIDTFIVNVKFIGLLQSIAGSETLVPIQTLLEQMPADVDEAQRAAPKSESRDGAPAGGQKPSRRSGSQWDKICFYVTPIGEEGSEQRKHSDLFLSHLIEPALEGFGLEVVRADKIGQAGMITSQVLEHLLKSKLVIADLSYHNPNVFYEMAIRHFTKLPIIQIGRKADHLPFDVNQIRTVSIDTTDIYTLIPKLAVYKAEIATLVRGSLEGQTSSNPISVFFPGITVEIPTA